MKTSAQSLLDRWQQRKAVAGIAAGVPWTPSVIARLSKSRSYEGGHRNSNSSSVRSAAFPLDHIRLIASVHGAPPVHERLTGLPALDGGPYRGCQAVG